NALAEEATSDMAKKTAPQTAPVVLTQQIEFVEFASKIRLVRVCIPLAFCKANQLASGAFDDETEPTPVRRLKRLLPLVFADLVGWPALEHGRMRLVKRPHVQVGQGRDVLRGRFANDKGFHVDSNLA